MFLIIEVKKDNYCINILCINNDLLHTYIYFILLITGAVTYESIIFIYENLNIFWHKSGTLFFFNESLLNKISYVMLVLEVIITLIRTYWCYSDAKKKIRYLFLHTYQNVAWIWCWKRQFGHFYWGWDLKKHIWKWIKSEF